MDENLLADEAIASDDQQPSPTPGRKVPVAKSIAVLLLLIGIFMLPVVTIVSLCHAFYIDATDPYRPPTISIVVDGCAGLDGARVPRAFNFTVGIDNPRGRFAHVHDVCVGPGEAVVLYGGVPLATGHVEERCAPPGAAAAVPVRTASGGVGMPSELAAMMAEEERARGVVELEVRVTSLEDYSLWCMAMLGGGAAQPSPCRRTAVKDQSDGFV
jgi:hypothetical protein